MCNAGAGWLVHSPRNAWWFGAACMLAALCVVLAALSSHAFEPPHSTRMQTAASQGLMHAVAVIALLGWGGTGVRRLTITMLAGAWLFVAALALSPIWPWTLRLTPWGGGLMILSWLALAVSAIGFGRSNGRAGS